MKKTLEITVATLFVISLSLTGAYVWAQNQNATGDIQGGTDFQTPPPPPDGQGFGPQGGQGPGGRSQRPMHPIEKVLDVNANEVIDVDEIANASVALKKLDTNGDGKLSADEYRPQRPQRPGGQR